MLISTRLELTDTVRIRITTSADGLAGIPIETYADTLLEMVVAHRSDAHVEVEVDERTDGPTKVRLSGLRGYEMTIREEMDLEEAVLEMARHSAFERCCEAAS